MSFYPFLGTSIYGNLHFLCPLPWYRPFAAWHSEPSSFPKGKAGGSAGYRCTWWNKVLRWRPKPIKTHGKYGQIVGALTFS